MLTQDEKDLDLMVVATVEEYGRRHGLDTDQVVALFRERGIFEQLRAQYDVLHMLDLDEGADFVDQYLAVSPHE